MPAFGTAHARAALGAWGLQDANVSPLPNGASGEVFLVETDDDRFVAKHAYQHRYEFGPGLLAAQVVARSTNYSVSAPVPTSDGELLAMVEHNGLEHPFAVLQWVRGAPVRVDSQPAARELGHVLGRVQRSLAQTAPAALGLVADDGAFLSYLRSTTQDLGEHRWLHARIAGIVGAIDRLLAEGTLTCLPGVWDGPERVRADDRIGLLDFGNAGWYPVAHVVGYGTSQVRCTELGEERRAIDSFLEAFVDEFPTPDRDLEAVGLFRLATIATYAKFMARRAAAGQLPHVMRRGFERVLAELEGA